MATRDILYRYEVRRLGAGGPRAEALIADVRALGMGTLRSAQETALYFVEGTIAPEERNLLGLFLFSDPVEERWECKEALEQPDAGVGPDPGRGSASNPDTGGAQKASHVRVALHIVEICRKPGVTDPVALEIVRAAHEMGLRGVRRAATGVRWELEADWLDRDALEKITRLLLANPVIERWHFGRIVPIFPESDAPSAQVQYYDCASMTDNELLALSADRRLALDLGEMRAIRTWFRTAGRKATDVELEMLAQTWSEHCVHKTFKAEVVVEGAEHIEGGRKLPNAELPYPSVVDGIFKTYIKKTTEMIGAPWVHSAFTDNAGIVRFVPGWDISFKVETHNHPSAVEPFGGANTGVGGVIRDIMGVSARPIAVTDVLCFGDPRMDARALPSGSLHPRMIARGVVAGVEDYGNKMGIPTVNGAVHFHPGYAANPLVYCGCVGLAPEGLHCRTPQAKDRIVVLGGRTGRDGIRGATFSSMTMDGSTGDVAGASVQIGDPIVQKRALDVLLEARDARLYHAVTDCGAGGLSSAVGEMAAELGADVELSKVTVKYPGLAPWELWLSEAQERMVLAVPPEHMDAFAALCRRHEAEFCDIGSFRDDGRLCVRMQGEVVLDLPMAFVHGGLPRKRLKARVGVAGPGQGVKSGAESNEESNAESPAELLLGLLSASAVSSREEVVRRYDHEVQGGTVVKPFCGPGGDAPADAAVLKPQGTEGCWGIALSNALRPDYGEKDPYRAAIAAVDEAVRNAVAAGADPGRMAILDNFCMGDPSDPEVMGALLELARGLRDAALSYRTPIISGKDSFYNEYLGSDGRRHAVPPSLLISALGFVPDIALACTPFLKRPRNPLWLVGIFKPLLQNERVPLPDSETPRIYALFHQAVMAGEVVSAHDLSEGGLGTALAEMCIGGRRGAQIDTEALGDDPLHVLIGETCGCLVAEVALEKEDAFAGRMQKVSGAAVRLGRVSGTSIFAVRHGAKTILELTEAQMRAAWKQAGKEVLP